MADGWMCGHCERVEDGKERIEGTDELLVVDAVCHHCGKPLCQEHQRRRIDEGFSYERREGRPESVHCNTCQLLPGHLPVSGG